MNAVYDFEKYQKEAHQRALDEAAPCPECERSVTPENWPAHFQMHHAGVSVPAFPVRETIAHMDTDSLGVAVARIRTDGGTQPRAQMNPVTVENYAEDMQSGAAFPPIVVFYDGSDYWLADGFHRLAAAKRAELEHIKADVRQGTRRDAVLFSVGANATHGLRRTNDDKRRAVMTLLHDDEWKSQPIRWMARQCAVSEGFVHKLQKELSVHGEQIKPDDRTVTRNGTTYTMNTGAIGKREPTTNGHTPANEPPAPQFAPAVVAFCKRYEIDEVDVLNAWQQVFERNAKAWKEAQRGYVTGLGSEDVAIEDMDATLVLICADEEAYERAMRQKAYLDEKKRQKAEEAAKRAEKVAAAQSLPDTVFNVIYADPPWLYDNNITSWGPASLHYDTMDLQAVCDLPQRINLHVADDAVLFLWVTNPFLQDAFKVLEAWGFEYKTNIAWVKTDLEKPGSGFYVRGRHELLFIATRGSFTPLDKHIAPPIGSVVSAPLQEHSRKPDEVYSIIERLYPQCNYVELFARREREGWTGYGDELS